MRIEVAGGRYHVTARADEGRPTFRQDRDRLRFLELLAQLPARFGVLAHAYVLMNKHYHLVLETPEANMSHAGRKRLGQMAALVGGCDDTTVAKAVSRFGQHLAKDRNLAGKLERMRDELSHFYV